MLVRPVEEINDIEQIAIPSRIVAWSEARDSLKESVTDAMGESVRYGFIKPIRVFCKGELDLSSLLLVGDDGRNDLPVSMIQGGAEIVNRVSTYHSYSVYDGFVLFGNYGALEGIRVCLKDIKEAALFAQQFVYILDVFRGPLDL
jgi:hypothetical protein